MTFSLMSYLYLILQSNLYTIDIYLQKELSNIYRVSNS